MVVHDWHAIDAIDCAYLHLEPSKILPRRSLAKSDVVIWIAQDGCA